MSRFYDRLLRASRRGKHTPLADPEFISYAKEDAADLPDTTVIAVDNVSQYFYEVSGNDEWRSGGGFPNVAPPMEQFFMETRRPKAIRDSKGRDVDDADSMPEAWGALFRCEDFKKTFGGDPDWRSNAREAFALSMSRLGLDGDVRNSTEDPFEMDLQEDVRWLMRLSCYMEDPELGRIFAGTPVRGGILLAAQQFVAVTEEGQIAHFVDGRRARFQMPMLSGEPHAYQMAMNSRVMAHPFMAAISFLHCKNVRLDLQQPPQKLSAKHRKNHGRPLCCYNLLEIGPMKEVLEGEGRRGEVGLARSFHICRGHFRTYTPERGGPFGRKITEQEIQYVSAHARGDRKAGEVTKDYKVNPSSRDSLKRAKPGSDPAIEAARRASAGNPSERAERASQTQEPANDAGASAESSNNEGQNTTAPSPKAASDSASEGQRSRSSLLLGSLKRALRRGKDGPHTD